MMFVDNSQTPFSIGFVFNSTTRKYAPRGKLRIARFTTAFWPEKGLGYYSDIYLHQFIRKWKSVTIVKKKRRIEKYTTVMGFIKTNLNHHVIRYICEFL